RAAQPPIKAPGIVAAFYAPWQETGLHSLRANASHMTHLLPAWVHLQESGNGLDFHDWDPNTVPHNNDVIEIAKTNNLNIVPVFSNAQMSEFDPKRVHRFLTNPTWQNGIIIQLRRWVLANGFQGINVDFENLAEEDLPLLVPFLQRLRASFAPAHLIVSADFEATRRLDWRAAAAACDFVVVMAYDEHGETSKPGPISSIGFYRKTLQRAVATIPREKLVIGLANYAYDWTENRDWAEPLTYQGALLLAQKYRPTERAEVVVDFDSQALNPPYVYDDDEGKEHEVWFLDAITAANQWMIAQNYAVRGVGIWVLGSTDPSLWTFVHRDRLNQPPNVGVLSNIEFPYDVEFVGDGEILHVDKLTTKGSRSIEVDPKTGLLLDEDYHEYPTSFVIRRTGYKPKVIALTIDDGPAEEFTDAMLDQLKRYDVKATFFLIGQNAERYPNMVRRIWNEGHEIGNHSFTHPNFGAISELQAQLELTSTQRVFQSLLHRSTLLFRPPYNADAEPTSREEVLPVMYGSKWNYVVVGEYIDPQDWNTEVRDEHGAVHRRTAQEMLDAVLQQLRDEKGSSILLHDGGGDRSETVKLIPLLITELRKRGYSFVTVSDLIGRTRDEVNPPVKNTDTFMLANDRLIFEAIYLFELFLGVAFLSAIILGAARVAFVTILAIVSKIAERRRTFDHSYHPRVSVVIAAYNEEKVISRTIHAVLANHYEPLDIIVVDDGSRDDTSGEVQRTFAGHAQVRLIRQENGGKAAALNRGIGEAAGEIIIALDADTLFARDTVAMLVRHFADPVVGAVAGNVKVGNRINPLTYWQSIEYVTSQNLDRRAYAVMNAVTVVPGAVGAWRREAIVDAGGYTTDTMAEDMDLTWRIRRAGWRVETDSTAVGYTEAPDTFGGLFRQRFRWAFGTLQCLWKHRGALGRYGWFGRLALPSLWIFQIAFQVLSPLIDLQILWTLGNVAVNWGSRGFLTRDWQPLPQSLTSLYVIGFMYAFFFVVELVGSLVAFKLDREDSRVLVWLFWQRFLYRQLMYAVLLKSLKTALSGIRAGWGKLERKGTVQVLAEPAVTELQM
ncbi:MAG: peptidoglycan-N-acetylglucosamine deacetylase, partial [Gemmatimonadaceae bacterium]|nr:peptidoglycan-N-acetylglucosamine deacetylase [Gemmatimonadaceae bacterium]